jgi:sterol desaturase/sphingolipid hydroxylase (fatty acid hydroxylase superfamily)
MLIEFCFGFLIIFLGYITKSCILQHIYYHYNQTNVHKWKIQPSQYHLGFYFIPILSSKPDRAPNHGLFSFINLVIASKFCGMIMLLTSINFCPFKFTCFQTFGILNIINDFIIAVVYECVAEYYWHRLMHTKYFYSIFHKFHHYYKAPEIWDDMYIHPVEAFGYYCILYAPPFLFHTHVISFILYMIFMGICGVLDHSGIRIKDPFNIYSTEDHDLHHSKFNINYGFPLPIMDILHGTYHGNFLGFSYSEFKK